MAMHALIHLSQFIAMAFVSGLWQGLAIVTVVAFSLRLLPRVGATLRFVVWAFAFLLLAIVPLLHFQTAEGGGSQAGSVAAVHMGAAWAYVIASLWASLTTLRLARLAMQAFDLRGIWKRATVVAASSEILAMLQHGRHGAILCTSLT